MRKTTFALCFGTIFFTHAMEHDCNELMIKAACKGDTQEVLHMLEMSEKNIIARDEDDHTPLMVAAKAGHSQVVKLL